MWEIWSRSPHRFSSFPPSPAALLNRLSSRYRRVFILKSKRSKSIEASDFGVKMSILAIRSDCSWFRHEIALTKTVNRSTWFWFCSEIALKKPTSNQNDESESCKWSNREARKTYYRGVCSRLCFPLPRLLVLAPSSSAISCDYFASDSRAVGDLWLKNNRKIGNFSDFGRKKSIPPAKIARIPASKLCQLGLASSAIHNEHTRMKPLSQSVIERSGLSRILPLELGVPGIDRMLGSHSTDPNALPSSSFFNLVFCPLSCRFDRFPIDHRENSKQKTKLRGHKSRNPKQEGNLSTQVSLQLSIFLISLSVVRSHFSNYEWRID